MRLEEEARKEAERKAAENERVRLEEEARKTETRERLTSLARIKEENKRLKHQALENQVNNSEALG